MERSTFSCDICSKEKERDELSRPDICYDCKTKALGLKNYRADRRFTHWFQGAFVSSIFWVIILFTFLAK